MASFLRKGVSGLLLGWLARLRFPYLFLLTTIVFILNLFIPDVIPFADEIIMGLVALLFGNLRKKPKNNNTSPDSE